MITDLRKHPNDVKYRKLRMDNLVIKKFVTGVDGANALVESVGFRKLILEVKTKKFNITPLKNKRSVLKY